MEEEKVSCLIFLLSLEFIAKAFKCRPIPGKMHLEESPPGLTGTNCVFLGVVFSSNCTNTELELEPSSMFFLRLPTFSKSRQRLRMPRCKLETAYRKIKQLNCFQNSHKVPQKLRI
jgi:hypothetical protein